MNQHDTKLVIQSVAEIKIDKSSQKKALRRSHLETRQSMTPEDWREKSDRICTHLQSLPLFTSARTILAYFSFRQEPDLSPLFANPQHQWGFSRVQGKTLSWHSWQPGEPLQKEKFGIFEPHPNSPRLSPKEVDLILVPAVACDERGYRLGYGGGFYDRMLSSTEWIATPTIGIVFEFAHFSQLPIDSWDKPLQAVCTETGFTLF